MSGEQYRFTWKRNEAHHSVVLCTKFLDWLNPSWFAALASFFEEVTIFRKLFCVLSVAVEPRTQHILVRWRLTAWRHCMTVSPRSWSELWKSDLGQWASGKTESQQLCSAVFFSSPCCQASIAGMMTFTCWFLWRMCIYDDGKMFSLDVLTRLLTSTVQLFRALEAQTSNLACIWRSLACWWPNQEFSSLFLPDDNSWWHLFPG